MTRTLPSLLPFLRAPSRKQVPRTQSKQGQWNGQSREDPESLGDGEFVGVIASAVEVEQVHSKDRLAGQREHSKLGKAFLPRQSWRGGRRA